MIIGSLIPVYVGMIVALIFTYQFGWNNRAVGNTSVNLSNAYGTVIGSGGWSSTGPTNGFTFVWSSIILGIVIVTLLTYLTPRVAVLRYFTPFGIILAWQYGMVFWIPCLIAALIRLIVVKTGGARLYEEKVLPWAYGSIVGAVIQFLLEIPIMTLIANGMWLH